MLSPKPEHQSPRYLLNIFHLDVKSQKLSISQIDMSQNIACTLTVYDADSQNWTYAISIKKFMQILVSHSIT
jgi:hypothetical protein